MKISIGMLSTRSARQIRVLVVVCLLFCALAMQAQWRLLGPEGGDARSLAYDPKNPDRILLGTSAGQLFESMNGGRSWNSFAHFGDGDDYVLDNIAFDPSDTKTIYVAAWSVESNGGDIFRSRDGGKTWQALPGMHGRSVRAFAIAQSDPRILTAAALHGIYRSFDEGDTWKRISPENDPGLKNFESLAVDPKDPDIIYAGTWHLPWKTSDGGQTWHNIKTGIIDDSDVFSIIIDHSNRQTIYASACSGIYKSETSGELFHKIQGIPGTARRTRVLQQNPVDPNVVYAGTTEGLFKTTDGGKTWKRITPTDYILNDVLIDPRNPMRLLIATDRAGVFASDDAGATFYPSNTGFSHRQITAVIRDVRDPKTLYASVVNDKEFGGVFVSHSAGKQWEQWSTGLDGSDVYDLAQASNGTLLAGTNQGIYRLMPDGREWQPANVVLHEKTFPPPKPRRIRGKLVYPKPKSPMWLASELTAKVNSLSTGDAKWFAATSSGLYSSLDAGNSWTGGEIEGERNFVDVTRKGKTVLAVTSAHLFVSTDDGATWTLKSIPPYVTRINSATIAGRTWWLATREGALRSTDGGQSWEHVLEGLPARNLITIDRAQNGLMLATAEDQVSVFISRDQGATWTPSAGSNYSLRRAMEFDGHLVAATAFNGLAVNDSDVVAALPEKTAGLNGNE